MSLLSLPRVKKPPQSPTELEEQKPDVVVKQEPLAADIKEEPDESNTSGEFLPSIVKKEPESDLPVEEKTLSPTEAIACPLKAPKKSEPTIVKKRTSNYRPWHGPRYRRRRPTPAGPRIPDFERAVRAHALLASRDPDSLSNKEVDTLTWAESVLVKETFRRNKNVAIDSNEAESCDTPESVLCEEVMEDNDQGSSDVEESEHIPAPRVNLCELADTLELAVVDFGKPGGRYSLENGLLIEAALGKAVVEHVLKNLRIPCPRFGRACWHDGVIVLDCKDQLSYEFAKLAVSEMKLWKRSILRAIPPEKIPFMSKGWLYVPDFGIRHDELLEVLRSQNPSVNMSKWRILEEDDFFKSNLKRFTLLMPDPPLGLLEHKRMKLFFGAAEVTLKLLVCNWPDEI